MLVDDAPRRIVSHVYNLLAASGFRPARLSIACLLFRFTPAIRGSASRRRPYHAPASDLFNPGASGPRIFAASRLQSAPSARGHIRRNRGVLPRRRSPVSGGRFSAAGRAHPRRLFRPSGFGRRKPCSCNYSPSFTYAPHTPVRFHTPPSPRACRACPRPGLRAGRKAPGPAALLLSCARPRRPIPAGLCGPRGPARFCAKTNKNSSRDAARTIPQMLCKIACKAAFSKNT